MTDIEPEAEPESETELPVGRTASDGYAFAALVCAVLGFIIPIVPAAAALMLARATQPPIAKEEVNPSVARIASLAETLAYISLAIIAALCAAMLLGILAKVITS
jgi:uncharacterized membrane protein YGL010W